MADTPDLCFPDKKINVGGHGGRDAVREAEPVWQDEPVQLPYAREEAEQRRVREERALPLPVREVPPRERAAPLPVRVVLLREQAALRQEQRAVPQQVREVPLPERLYRRKRAPKPRLGRPLRRRLMLRQQLSLIYSFSSSFHRASCPIHSIIHLTSIYCSIKIIIFTFYSIFPKSLWLAA